MKCPLESEGTTIGDGTALPKTETVSQVVGPPGEGGERSEAEIGKPRPIPIPLQGTWPGTRDLVGTVVCASWPLKEIAEEKEAAVDRSILKAEASG